MRNSKNQAQMVIDSAKRKWGSSAWERFSESEKERILGFEFMCLLAAQAPDSNEALNHYRETARVLCGAED